MATSFFLAVILSAFILSPGISPAAATSRRLHASPSHDYGDALTKSIMFFEGQRSGKLPRSQRLTWRKDSALKDGSDIGMDLVGGYYDAGDNVKFHLPMAFSTTMLGWSITAHGNTMGYKDLRSALDALRWGTDYFLKATSRPGQVVAQVGDPVRDHNCWERPEDMDTLRTTYVLNRTHPGSEVAGEIAAALAVGSIAFKTIDLRYSKLLLGRALQVFEFGEKFRGSYSNSVAAGACPFYCSPNGYMDELVWAAAWLFQATGSNYYLHFAKSNLATGQCGFNWDSKFPGAYILLSEWDNDFASNADNLVCEIMPESPSKIYTYTPGGLLYSIGAPSNLQNPTSLGFLLSVYSKILRGQNRVVKCGNNVQINPSRIRQFVKSQADYILGSNPLGMSYMVGYGNKYPKKIHHRGSILPSMAKHPSRIQCSEGYMYFTSMTPNPNVLIGAVPGGPDILDGFKDTQLDVSQSEPTTYINAPFVGVLAFLKGEGRVEFYKSYFHW
ncbi:Endoglucanase 8 [Linum grandiflorum]